MSAAPRPTARPHSPRRCASTRSASDRRRSLAHCRWSVGSAVDSVDAIVQLSFSVQALLGEIAAEHELSITQLRLLGILRDREPAMLDLARRLDLEKSSVTGLIDRAQRRGLVDRAAAPDDGRVIHVRLTAEGRRLTEQIAAQANETLSRLLGALPARDRARLSTLAGTVVRQHAASRAVDLGTQRTQRS